MKKYLRVSKCLTITIILFVIIIGICLNYIVYQKKIIQENDIVIEEVSEQISVLTGEKERLLNKLSKLNKSIEILNLKISEYLNAENRKCERDVIKCLDELINKLTPSEVKCEPISDGFCPSFCGLSLDYDCCIEKGLIWEPGRGCYSR